MAAAGLNLPARDAELAQKINLIMRKFDNLVMGESGCFSVYEIDAGEDGEESDEVHDTEFFAI